MHIYRIYYEPADEDTERVYLGDMRAETASQALHKAAQYYEYPEHDLVCELVQ